MEYLAISSFTWAGDGYEMLGVMSSYFKHNSLSKIKGIVTSGVGGLFSALLYLGYKPVEIVTIYSCIIRLSDPVKYLAKVIKRKMLGKIPTLNILYAMTRKELAINTIENGVYTTISYDTHPDMDILAAILASYMNNFTYNDNKYEDASNYNPVPSSYYDDGKKQITAIQKIYSNPVFDLRFALSTEMVKYYCIPNHRTENTAISLYLIGKTIYDKKPLERQFLKFTNPTMIELQIRVNCSTFKNL